MRFMTISGRMVGLGAPGAAAVVVLVVDVITVAMRSCFKVVEGNFVLLTVTVAWDRIVQFRKVEAKGVEEIDAIGVVTMLGGVVIGGNQRSRGMRGS